jgi:hypothetical protein
METHDGFIIGVHHYCDRWCERCRFTHRCRQFADEQQCGLTPAVSASPAAEWSPGRPPAPDAATAPAAVSDPEGVADPRFDVGARVLQVRLHALTTRLRDASLMMAAGADPAMRAALDVLNYYWLVASAKLYRALKNERRDPALGGSGDADGSAKVVLLALDRLEEAWHQVTEAGIPSGTEDIAGALAALAADIERRFPRARQFVRPGFDEPVAVAMLEWQERG